MKCTIVTAYTQGNFKYLKRFSINLIDIGVEELAGPTVVSKVISEASATSSSDTPLKKMIQDTSVKIDSRKNSLLNGVSLIDLKDSSESSNLKETGV